MTKPEARGTGYVRTLAHGPAEYGLVRGSGVAHWELTPLGEAPSHELAWEALREHWRKPAERTRR